jgi:hypothetical protein
VEIKGENVASSKRDSRLATSQGRISPIHCCGSRQLPRLLPALAEGQATHACPAGRWVLVWKCLWKTNQPQHRDAEPTRRLTEEKLPISSSRELQVEGSALGGSTGAHADAVELIRGDAQFGGTKSTTEDEEDMLFRCGKP